MEPTLTAQTDLVSVTPVMKAMPPPDVQSQCKNVGSSSCTKNGTTYYNGCGASKCSSGQTCSNGTCVTTAEDCSAYKKSPWVVNGPSVYSSCQALGSYIPSSTTATCGGTSYNKCQVTCPTGYADCTTAAYGHSPDARKCSDAGVGGKKCWKIMVSSGSGCSTCNFCKLSGSSCN